jgi:Mce-associated membrane protein
LTIHTDTDTDSDVDSHPDTKSDHPSADTTGTTSAADAAGNPDHPDDSEDRSDADDGPQERSKRRRWKRMPPQLRVLLFGVAMVAVLAALCGWLGWQAYQSHQADQQRGALLQAGRQGALNLTTIDWEHADSDVQRILSSATGTFHDDFEKRSQPFIDVLKQAQSKSEGTITAAALESANGNEASVLVAVSVKITNAGAPEQNPRSWRMRVSVQKVGDDVKVSNVEFVP